MNVKCNDCHAVGEAKTNNRGQTRCAYCYSLNVEPLPATPEPIVPAAADVPTETADEPVKARRKRGAA